MVFPWDWCRAHGAGQGDVRRTFPPRTAPRGLLLPCSVTLREVAGP